MRAIILLTIVGLAAAQFPFFQQRNRNQVRSQQRSLTDDRHGASEYHYSWRHGQPDFEGHQARSYCQRLGNGWHGVDINNRDEDNFVTRVVQGERQKYIWTGGVKSGGRFLWSDRSAVHGLNWSHTGGLRSAQPDNRDGNENCLGVLNNFYGDGVKWHDVACHHRKPVICERSSQRG